MLAQQVVHRARAHAGVSHRLVVGRGFFGIGQELICIGHGKVFARQHDQGIDRDHLNQAEIFTLVFDGGIGQGRQNQLVGRALENGVTVGRAGQNFLGRNAAAGTAQVFNDHRLAQMLGQGGVQGARNHIGHTAGGVRHHQGDGLAGKGLGQRGARQQQPGQHAEKRFQS